MSKKILLIGGSGLLGNAFAELIAETEHSLFAPSRSELDLLNVTQIKDHFVSFRPDYVINCAGYNLVDLAEEDAEAHQLAELLNVEAIKRLSELAKDYDVHLVQFSSDYVFDGENNEGYEEHAQRNAVNKYGLTKLKGEDEVINADINHYLVRISWLFGPGKKNFVTTMMDLADKLEELKVVNDQFGKPTYTKDVALRVIKMIDENAESGVYHLPNEGVTTWHDFAEKILELSDKSVKLTPVTSQEFKRPAARPKHSALVNSKQEPLRHWEEALKDYLQYYV